MKAFTSSYNDEYGTPIKLFRELDAKYHFTLDPCASDLNHKCEKYYTKEQDGLIKSWKDERVFCNPPYSDIKRWVQKCYAERNNAQIIVMLIYARTGTNYFHEYIYHTAELVFLKGRITFEGSNDRAPMPSMLVIYRPDQNQISF